MGAKSKFPHKVECRNGTTVTIRPMKVGDVDNLMDMLDALDVGDKALLCKPSLTFR